MGRVMSVFMNMDKMVGPMFEKGLANLKGVTEKEHAAAMETAKAAPTVEIMNGDRAAASYGGSRAATSCRGRNGQVLHGEHAQALRGFGQGQCEARRAALWSLLRFGTKRDEDHFAGWSACP